MPKSSLYFDESAIFLVHALSISFDIFPPTFISGIPMLMPVSITDTTPFAMVSELSFLNRFFRYSALARDTWSAQMEGVSKTWKVVYVSLDGSGDALFNDDIVCFVYVYL